MGWLRVGGASCWGGAGGLSAPPSRTVESSTCRVPRRARERVRACTDACGASHAADNGCKQRMQQLLPPPKQLLLLRQQQQREEQGGGGGGGGGRCLDHGSVREKLLAVQLRLVRGHTRPGLPRTRPGIVGVSDLHLCRGFRVPGRHEAAMKPRRGVRGYDVSRDMRPGETRALCLCACLTSPPGKQQLGGLVTCRRSRRRRRTCPPPPTPWRPWGARCGRPGGRNVNSLSTVTQRHEPPPPPVLIGPAASPTPY